MTVSVNQVNNDVKGRNQNLLVSALGLATDLYKVNLNDKQVQAANDLKQAQLIQDQEKLAASSKKEEEKEKREIAATFLPLPGPTKKSVSFTHPGYPGISHWLPRVDQRAEENNATTLAAAGKKESKEADEQRFSRTMKLSDDYNKESKTTVSAIEGYNKLEAAALNPKPTGATDVALLYGYMKSIDPGSTVREGEFANAEQAQGVPDQIRSLYNKAREGVRLSPELRMQFLEEGKRALQAQLGTQKQIDERYMTRAQNFGTDPTYVVNKQFEDLRQKLGDLKLAGKNAPRGGPVGPAQDGVAYGASGDAPPQPKYQPGTIIRVGGKRYLVNADGETGTEIRDEAGFKAAPPETRK